MPPSCAKVDGFLEADYYSIVLSALILELNAYAMIFGILAVSSVNSFLLGPDVIEFYWVSLRPFILFVEFF